MAGGSCFQGTKLKCTSPSSFLTGGEEVGQELSLEIGNAGMSTGAPAGRVRAQLAPPCQASGLTLCGDHTFPQGRSQLR